MSIQTNDVKLLHSSCFFNKCSRNNHGGAIYFFCQSSIVQHRFCTTNTYVTGSNSGFHSYVHLFNNNFDRQNYIIKCSISNCSQQNGYHITMSYYGNFGIFSSNYSQNSVNYYSGFHMVYTKGASMISFSTFEGNQAQYYICLFHHTSPDGFFQDYKCNIVNNTQESTNYGTVHAADKVTMIDCTVIGSDRKGKLFSRTNNGYLYLYNCRVDNTIVFTTNGAGGTFYTNFVITAKDLNVLAHLSSYNCLAKIRLDASIKLSVCNENSCDYNAKFSIIYMLSNSCISELCYLY